MIGRLIVPLLKRTKLMEAEWQFTRNKRQCLCCGTGRQNQFFKYQDVTVGNMEASPSSDASNRFKRQAVSCATREHTGLQ
jgi:hypothetical protein